jgi:hypothetical protein
LSKCITFHDFFLFYHIHILQFPSVSQSVCPSVWLGVK